MQLRQPDPAYTTSPRARANFVLAVKLAFGLLAVIWAVFGFERLLDVDLTRFGLRPREAPGLLGLFTTPLLHAGLGHIVSNTIPLFVGATALLFLYPNSALRVLPMLYVGSAALAWVFARPSVHIGASGLVYAILGYVFVAGIVRGDLRSVGVSLAIWFLYGSMLWGVLPVERGTSWELHASGLVIGVALALIYRRWDRPPLKRYAWEDEEDDADNDFDFPGERRDWRERDEWR